ncbi:hypothetical protein C3Y87_06120 [Carbonactinospora thermoautotrophica]|uniref:hypothetical protein n=1 Tax=Carbonactinospora thermoautotrophica TaxID=1469144 RepID=UPI0022717A4A|nr:hypothetical protein [Carbonactinospora thermoautotrophica]MCX9190993.1 hypothetical protein [Carbonactinospora thermoautotrophica]
MWSDPTGDRYREDRLSRYLPAVITSGERVWWLRLRRRVDVLWQVRLLGEESLEDTALFEMSSVQYELWAAPPDRWRLRRGGRPAGLPLPRDERIIEGNRWYWLGPDDGVEWGDAADSAPPTFRHLFEPWTLLERCQVSEEGAAPVAGRPARVVVARPRDGADVTDWGAGADSYRLHLDAELDVALRAEASGQGRVFQVEEVLELREEPDPAPDLFRFTPGPDDVLYRTGESGPGKLLPLEDAVRAARAAGFDLLLPYPLPEGARLRAWLHRPGAQPRVRVQVDLADGARVVLVQRVAGPGEKPLWGNTYVEVSGSLPQAEQVLAGLAPVS